MNHIIRELAWAVSEEIASWGWSHLRFEEWDGDGNPSWLPGVFVECGFARGLAVHDKGSVIGHHQVSLIVEFWGDRLKLRGLFSWGGSSGHIGSFYYSEPKFLERLMAALAPYSEM